MTVTLSSEQRDALQHQGDAPVYVLDPEKQDWYVLLPAKDYQRVRALLESEDFDLSESYALQERVAAAEGWDDPAMDDYNSYDAHRKAL
jgi:hypothetical protein